MRKRTGKASTGTSTRKGKSRRAYPLVGDAGRLVTTDKKKTEVLNNFFVSVFLITACHTALKHLVWQEGIEEAMSVTL